MSIEGMFPNKTNIREEEYKERRIIKTLEKKKSKSLIETTKEKIE